MSETRNIRITLTPEQTAEIVQQAGGSTHLGRCFVVAHPGSYPAAPGVLVMNLIECPSMKAAAGAVDVALGTHRAVKLKEAIA